MFRVLGRIEIFGTKASIDKLVSVASIPDGEMKKIGEKRNFPDVDSWYYASPWYRFHLDTMDHEVRDFLTVHSHVGEALAVRDAGITYAFLTLCPVGKKRDTIQLIPSTQNLTRGECSC